MVKALGFLKYTAIFLAIFLLGIALAQTTSIGFDPRTWFETQETVFAAVALIVPWITKALTALGKDWFNTDGRATQWLSLVVAFLVAGVGGFLGLGYLAGATGLVAALQAGALTAFAFLMSNGMAKNDRQVAQATAVRIHALEEGKRLK